MLAIAAGIALGATAAQATPITSITATGATVELQSVTVGGFSANVSALANGSSSGTGCTNPGGSDDFVLTSVTTGCDPQIVDLTGLLGPASLYTDVNGDGFDLFIFEIGGDEEITIQAILTGGVLGDPIAIGTGPTFWGDTGFDTLSQDIVGLALKLTDLLDASGTALTNASLIEGIQINRGAGGLDPTSISVFVPEPSTLSLMLLALGGLGLTSRRPRG